MHVGKEGKSLFSTEKYMFHTRCHLVDSIPVDAKWYKGGDTAHLTNQRFTTATINSPTHNPTTAITINGCGRVMVR